jgi:ribosomal protein L20
MPRSRAKVPAHARHKKILKQAKGFRGRRKNTFTNAAAAVWKAGEYAYVGPQGEETPSSARSGSSASTRLSASMTKT